MKLFTIMTIALFSLAAAADCQYSLNTNDLKVEWTAYKTPSKVGVAGQFTELGVSKKKFTATTTTGLFKGVDFAISTQSVATKDKQRDKKISTFFFKNVPSIKGEVLEASNEEMLLQLEMNGVKREVPMKATLKGDIYKAEGVLDILDFSMSEHLQAINKVCEELHLGKTWSDVNISLSARINSDCE